MPCLKCAKKEYFSKLCREHFNFYFERKFMKHLSANKLLKKDESLNVLGANKEVLKYLLRSLGRKTNTKFSAKARNVETFTLTEYSVKQLNNLMTKGIKKIPSSFLECFTQEETEQFAKMHKLKISKPVYTKQEDLLKKLMDKVRNQRPNIYYCNYNMLKNFQKVLK